MPRWLLRRSSFKDLHDVRTRLQDMRNQQLHLHILPARQWCQLLPVQ
jgi:hypothetical protein